MSLYSLARTEDAQGLENLLRESDSPAVRRRAAILLGDIIDDEHHDCIESLIDSAANDDVEEVRAAAIDGLDDIGSEAIEQLLVEFTGQKIADGADWAVAKRFANALSADIPELRMAAASALGKLGDPNAVKTLVNTLSDENENVRIKVCNALSMINHQAAVPGLVERLNDDSGRVRYEAALSLARIGGGQAIQALSNMLSDSNPSIRRIAASALADANTVKAIPPLIDVLDDPRKDVRDTALYSIIELLSVVPTEQSHSIRESTMDALVESKNETIEPLINILKNSDQSQQRRSAAWFLGRVVDSPSKNTITILIDTIQDDDRMTAQFAATSLVELGGEHVEQPVIELVSDASNDDDARAKGVYVLGQIGSGESLNVVNRLTEDESRKVRSRAFSAVSKLKSKKNRF